MKILTIIGARPQFIKAAAVSRVVRERDNIEEVLLHTGQHYDNNMSDIFFDELEIPTPTHNLGIGSANHGAQTGQMLAAIEEVIFKEMPDCVLIYGDTNSTLAGALAAVKLHIPVAHVEAGLRSFNRRMPEEINRLVADQVSDILFPPTTVAVDNLKTEGVPDSKVHLVGDVMYDVALYFGDKAQRESNILSCLSLQPKKYALATIHRAENTDDPQRLQAIFAALTKFHQDLPVVLPLHPRTKKCLSNAGLLEHISETIHIIEPLGFLDMLQLEKNAALIATDSGGVQKEAFFQRVPCVTLRDETEWVKIVELGWNTVTPPTDPQTIYQALSKALTDGAGQEGNPYGDGDSAEKIVSIIQNELS